MEEIGKANANGYKVNNRGSKLNPSQDVMGIDATERGQIVKESKIGNSGGNGEPQTLVGKGDHSGAKPNIEYCVRRIQIIKGFGSLIGADQTVETTIGNDKSVVLQGKEYKRSDPTATNGVKLDKRQIDRFLHDDD